MSKYHDFKDHEICFFDSKKVLPPIRGYKADFETFIDFIPQYEHRLLTQPYNTYCSICQYESIPLFPIQPKKLRWEKFKEWVSVRDLSIKGIDFFMDFDGKDLKSTFQDVKNAREHLLNLIGNSSIYLNCYFSGNKGFHLLGKMGESFGKTPAAKLKKNYEIAMQLKLLCPTIDETIYDLARVRKLIGSKVHSPQLGETRVITCDNDQDFETIQKLLNNKNYSEWEKMPIKRLNKIELTNGHKP
ncbi:MAG: hypothetical protein WCI04_05115 [archaeon]